MADIARPASAAHARWLKYTFGATADEGDKLHEDILAVIANQMNEDVVAVITSDHDNVDTRCCCTCWLAQVIWCIGETQGDAHSIASSVLAVAVVTVRLHMGCAMM